MPWRPSSPRHNKGWPSETGDEVTEWVSVGSVESFEQGGTRIDVSGHRLAIFRINDSFYVIGDRCTHAEASLAEGELFGGEVECPRHGSEFNIKTGKPGALPATRPVPTFEVNVDEDQVMVLIEPIEESE